MNYPYTDGLQQKDLGSFQVTSNITIQRLCVMHIIGDLHAGGAETMLVKLLSGMDKERLQNIVVTMRGGGSLQTKIESLGIPVLCLNIAGLSTMLFGLWRLQAYQRRYLPHLIQGWMYHGSLLASVSGLLTFNKIPVVWNIRHSLHDLSSKKLLTSIIIRVGAWLSFLPSRIIYNSITSSAQHHAVGYVKSRTVHIPNGFNTLQFKPSNDARCKLRAHLKLDIGDRIVGLVARYHPIKDFQNFLEAAEKLSKKYNDIHFVLAGRGVDDTNQELIQKIRQHQLDTRCHLLGEINDTSELTAGFDVATSCSRSEAFSNTIGESMACAVPCVVTNVGDSAVIVGNTGLVVPPGNSTKLASAWESILGLGQDERQNLGFKARERIHGKYSLPVIIAQYQNLYEELTCNAMKISGSTVQASDS